MIYYKWCLSSFILKDFSVMLYFYFFTYAKSWSTRAYPRTPTFSLQPQFFMVSRSMVIAKYDRAELKTFKNI